MNFNWDLDKQSEFGFKIIKSHIDHRGHKSHIRQMSHSEVSLFDKYDPFDLFDLFNFSANKRISLYIESILQQCIFPRIIHSYPF